MKKLSSSGRRSASPFRRGARPLHAGAMGGKDADPIVAHRDSALDMWDCNDAILRATDRQTLLEQVCRITASQGSFVSTVVWWISEGGTTSSRVASAARSFEYRARMNAEARLDLVQPRRLSPAINTLRSGEVSVCNDVCGDPNINSLPLLPRWKGINACAAFPVRQNGLLAGALAVYSGITGDFDAATVTALQRLAENVSLALDRIASESRTSQAEAELAIRDRQLRIITDAMPALISYIDADARYQFMNQGYEAFYGKPRTELVGRKLSELLAPADWQRLSKTMQRTPPGEIGHRLRKLRDVNGALRYFRNISIPDMAADGRERGRFLLNVEITDQMHAEQALRQEAERQAKLAAFGRQALADTDLDRLLQQTMALLRETLPGDRTSLLQLAQDGESLLLRVHSGWPEGLQGTRVGTLRPGGQSGALLGQGDPIRVDDYETETRYPVPRLIVGSGLRSSVRVQVAGVDRPFGILEAWSATPSAFGEQDESFLQSVATLITAAVKRKRTESQLLRAAEMYAALGEINEAIVQVGDRQALLERACAIATQRGGFSLAAAWWLDGDGVLARRIAGATADPADGPWLEADSAFDPRTPRMHSPTVEVLRSAQESARNDFATQVTAAAGRVAPIWAGIQSSAAFPLRMQGALVGAFSLYSKSVGEFDEKVMDLMRRMAANISFALDHLAEEARRREAETVLAEREHQLRTITDSLPAMICYIDRDWRYRFMNRAYETFYARPREEMLGLQVADLLSPEDMAKLRESVREGRPGQERRRLRVLRDYTGAERHLQSLTIPDIGPDGRERGRFVLNTDVTELVRAEQALKEDAQKQGVLTAFSRRALADADLDSLWGDAVSILSNTLPCEYSSALQLAGDGHSLVLKAASEPNACIGETFGTVNSGSNAVLLQSRGVVRIDDYAADNRVDAFYRPLSRPVRSAVRAAIWGPDRPYGLLCAYGTRAGQFTERDEGFVEGVANVLAAAITRKLTEEQLQRAAKLYRTLGEINEAIGKAEGAKALFDQACHIATRHGGFTLAAIWQIDSSTRRATQVARVAADGSTRTPGVIDLDAPKVVTPAYLAMTSGTIEVVNDIARDERTRMHSLPPDWKQFRASAAFPLRDNGAVVGAMALYATHTDEFDDHAVDLMSRIAANLSFALNNLRHTAMRREAEEASRHNEHQLRTITDALPVMISYFDRDRRYTFLNKEYENFYGRPRSEMLGRHYNQVVDPNDLAALGPELTPEENRRVRRRLRTMRDHTGRDHRMDSIVLPDLDEQGEARGSFVLNIDVTDRLEAEESLRREAERQEKLAAFGRAALDANSLDQVCAGAIDLLAGTMQADRCSLVELSPDGQTLVAKAAIGAPDDWHGSTFAVEPGRQTWALLQQVEPLRINDLHAEQRFLAPRLQRDRDIRSAVRVQVPGVEQPFGILSAFARQPARFNVKDENFLQSVANVLSAAVKRKRTEEQLAYVSQFDSLTHLPNRSLFRDRLLQSIAQLHRHRTSTGLLFVGLDRFSAINDTLGHSAGDELLRIVAGRLQSCTRAGDTVGRFAADIFAVVLSDLRNPQDAGAVGQKMLAALTGAVNVSGQEVFPSASVGIALAPADTRDADELIRNAESAMYQAKQLGGTRIQYYMPALNEHAVRRLTMEAELRRALERGEFVLHYQPKLDLRHGTHAGFEALLRWRHPQRGLVSPIEFVPLLEETGLIILVGEWVVREACRQVRTWGDAGVDCGPVAVNVSAKQFQRESLLATVRGAVEDAGIEPGMIQVEITESSLVGSPEDAARILAELRAYGVRTAIDDFGTGYSSLAYLKRFKLDTLKVDKSFVRDVTTDPEDAAIVRAIIHMAHSMGLKVVAEGVETAAQLAFLRARNCDEIQGYYLSRPLAVQGVAAFMESRPQVLAGYDERARTVLIVDDCSSDRTLLAGLLSGEGYAVHQASNSLEALEVLAREPTGIVVSDQRMPGMSGSELLARVKGLYPDMVRILWSGANDTEALAGALNAGAVQKFISKNWAHERLSSALREAAQKLRDN